jgi:cysteine desulfurase
MAVYFDHAATTPIRPEVVLTYTEHLQLVGNPSSVHTAGQGARRVLEEAREQLAKSVDANRNEVIFTSGGTESDNLAIKGLYWQRNLGQNTRPVILSAYTEHHAVIDSIHWLENEQGAKPVWIPVDERGVVDLDWLANYLAEHAAEVSLITLMWANNETGVVTPIDRVVELAKPFEIPVHSDAVAAFGHIPISFKQAGLQAMSITAHKVGGPVGVGALIVSRQSKLTSLIHGGGQERALRSGTMNSAGAKAFALAGALAVAEIEEHTAEMQKLSERLVRETLSMIPDARFSRGDAPGLADNAHFTFPGCSGDSLLFLLDQAGVCVSNGSACQAGVSAASHVLLTMGRSESEASSCIRVTFGRGNTQADVDTFLAALPEAHALARKAGYTTS